MNDSFITTPLCARSNPAYSPGEIGERRALRPPPDEPSEAGILQHGAAGLRSPIRRRAISAPELLNEAGEYGSAFTRGLRLDFPNGMVQLLISGTASVGPAGETLHAGDFAAQCWRTFRNITGLLESQEATWHDVVRTTCYSQLRRVVHLMR
jgi:hypothetical protein